jgi:UDP-N-acetylglucosamine 2-epimerase (non-hydrolysing)
MRIILAIGTRPEAIKMATLYLALKKDSRFTVKLCVTGQHSTMMDDALSAFDIIPDINLNVMSPNQSLNLLVSKIFSEFDSLIEDFNPELIIVHGDTSSAMACSLASYLRRVRLMHVEAGLRTHNLNSPWPEEGNRQITSRVADFHFAPTLLAKSNLLKEGVDENKILITGNTVIDALLYSIEKLNKTKPDKVLKLLSNSGFIYNPSRKIILVTGHRRENFGQGFLNICIGLKLISEKFPEIDIVYPVHLNPSVKIPVTEKLGSSKNIHLIEPLGYLDFVWLLNIR